MKKLKNILLIEDNLHDQFFFSEALKEIADAKLLCIANNGKEALKKLREPGMMPDIIFMDLHMPVMNGIQCLTKIKNNVKTQHIPVIILSTDIENIESVKNLGARAFIQKPCDSNELCHPIKKMILAATMNGQNGSMNNGFEIVLNRF